RLRPPGELARRARQSLPVRHESRLVFADAERNGGPRRRFPALAAADLCRCPRDGRGQYLLLRPLPRPLQPPYPPPPEGLPPEDRRSARGAVRPVRLCLHPARAV